MPDRHVAIIGAGAGGLACAARLAAAGCRVTVLDAGAAPGGKLRQLQVGGLAIDSGPTVLTMRFVFDELFDACGATLDGALTLTPLPVLARHAWESGGTLDLFADRARSEDAIAAFAGPAEARGYRDFCARSARVYATLRDSFIRADRPTRFSLTRAIGLRGLSRIAPFTTLWKALGQHFKDPRLRQLFGRYATYCGASPMSAPATLMLVAHVEQAGVWTVAGGMQALATAVTALATRHGAEIRTSAPVAQIILTAGRPSGLRLASGEVIAADHIVCNADAAALAGGLFGALPAAAMSRSRQPRSLSAMTWSIAGRCSGLDLQHHNVLFAGDYAAEFDDIFRRGRMPQRPTIYVCAPDARAQAPATAPQPLFCIMNAPAIGDRHVFTEKEIARCDERMTALFSRCGLQITRCHTRVTTPTDFAAMFPATGGALYGPATHGPTASFRRPGARTAIPGLYLAGGSAHPGPGVPMAVLSGQLAANAILRDSVSTSLSRAAATAGGISTR